MNLIVILRKKEFASAYVKRIWKLEMNQMESTSMERVIEFVKVKSSLLAQSQITIKIFEHIIN